MSEIILKRPKGRHRRFSLLRKAGGNSITLQLPELDSINDALLAQTLDLDRAELQVRDLKARLLKEERPNSITVFNGDNLKLLDEYMARRYRPKVRAKLVSPKAAYNEMRRAVEAVGNLNLRTATIESLEDSIDASGTKQARLARGVNRILQFINRDIRIPVDAKDRPKVRSIRLKDWWELESKIKPDWFRVLCGAAFASGCRLGELFAISEEDWERHKGMLFVQAQIDHSLQRRSTKNKRERWTVVIPQLENYLRSWLILPDEEKLRIRKMGGKFAKMIRKYCVQTFTDKSKHLTFHDFRHAFARHVLKRDPSISRVADYLGDSVVVAKEHYLGFIRDADEIAMTRERLLREDD